MSYSEQLLIANITGATSSGDTKSNPITVKTFRKAHFFLKCSKANGTTPTLDVKIMAKDAHTGDWYDWVSFTQVGGSTGHEVLKDKEVPAQIAIDYTIGGTSPEYDFIVSACLKD